MLGEPRADHAEIDGRIFEAVRYKRSVRVFAGAVASCVAARAIAGIGDRVQWQDRMPLPANHSAACLG